MVRDQPFNVRVGGGIFFVLKHIFIFFTLQRRKNVTNNKFADRNWVGLLSIPVDSTQYMRYLDWTYFMVGNLLKPPSIHTDMVAQTHVVADQERNLDSKGSERVDIRV